MKRMLLFIFCALFIFCDLRPVNPPESPEFPIYDGVLRAGFDLGVEDSQKQRKWLHDMGGYLRMAYPSGLEWGAVFITAAALPYDNIYEDFSNFQSLSVDLRGQTGDEFLSISIEDVENGSHFSECITGLTTDWQTFEFSLDRFSDINLKKLRAVIKFTFFGSQTHIVDFKNVKYWTKTVNYSARDFPILTCCGVAPGCEIGCNSSDSLKNWISYQYGVLKMLFPSGQSWATAFVVCKSPLNLSKYDSLCMEIKGEIGGEIVHIGINDTLGEDIDIGKFIKWKVTTDWKKVAFPLLWLRNVNLAKIYLPVQYASFELKAQIIYVRNVKYCMKK